MAKVNVGLRGWRFDEDALFAADGTVRPFDEMDEDVRDRLVRVIDRAGDPCDACWLLADEDDREDCPAGTVIYGEPRGDVLLCPDHERDFVYWFREDADDVVKGRTEMADAFYAWLDQGHRAPDQFEGVEHVDEDPDAVPDTDALLDALPGVEDELEATAASTVRTADDGGTLVDLSPDDDADESGAVEPGADEGGIDPEEEAEALDVDVDDLDV